MKKKVSRTAANLGSKREKGISREIRVIDLQTEFGIDSDALNMVMVLSSPHYLFYKVCDCLRGFNAHMQNQIVEALSLNTLPKWDGIDRVHQLASYVTIELAQAGQSYFAHLLICP